VGAERADRAGAIFGGGRLMRLAPVIAAAALGLFVPGSASGHGLRTAYLELTESADGDVVGTLRTALFDSGLRAGFPDACAARGERAPRNDRVRTVAVHCAHGLAGRTITILGLGPVHTEAIVRLTRAGGQTSGSVLVPERPSWRVPLVDAWTAVASEYLALGVAHIFGGPDHLLFLLALVLYVRRIRRLIWAESAFTLSHSITFSATALGWLRVSAPAAEACIALSLVLLALEIRRDREGAEAGARAPRIALVFGLVHGLGFAGGLAEIGVPERAAASALAAFGAGVEIGQLAILAMALIALEAARRLSPSSVRPIGVAAAYAVGVTGCYWLAERLSICFSLGS
jgi:hydrogenase/urease accessory protein HupE